ncbi:MAG: DMT family transporter [FCB group bacterium]|nr:DMT family transporter [FCB group bacterium]MBL7029141.1 DMT family transporter [Candidatus Neomarinimicrobiota bacterium]MBL7122052.1 DMT family transporter [Candidatus Neomarinimicrobiota bacterium]
MKRSENTFLYVIMILAMALWGLSWTNGKILGTYTSIPILMFWRFLIAGIFMWFTLILRGVEWRITLAGLPSILGSAVFLVLYNHFYFTGTRLGAAGAGGVLVTTLNPVLTFLLVSVVHKKLPRGRSLGGLLLGIFGGSILINVWQDGWSAIFTSGNQYFVLCASTWAFLTLISSKINQHMSTLTYSFWLYLVSAVLALFFVDTSAIFTVFTMGLSFWLNLISISVGAMAFATTAYFIAASRLGSEKASAFIFTVPLSALLFSMLILNEPLKLNILLGGTISIIAVFLINSAKKSN